MDSMFCNYLINGLCCSVVIRYVDCGVLYLLDILTVGSVIAR